MSTLDQHAGHNHAGHGKARGHEAGLNETGLTAIDPVCGMTVTVTPETRTESFGDLASISAQRNVRPSSRQLRGSTSEL